MVRTTTKFVVVHGGAGDTLNTCTTTPLIEGVWVVGVQRTTG